MKIQDKAEVVNNYCETVGLGECDKCLLDELCETVMGDFKRHPDACEKAYEIINRGNTEQHDVVNHPSHYCREGAIESIDEMELVFGVEAVKHFCLCNAWKYRYRASSKNGEEDLKKSDWYMRKYQELCER